MLNSVQDVGGDNEAIGGGIGNEDPVIRCGEGVIQFPAHTWVLFADPLRGGMRRVSLRRGKVTAGIFVVVVLPVVLQIVLPLADRIVILWLKDGAQVLIELLEVLVDL
jgi:hypothetical protein